MLILDGTTGCPVTTVTGTLPVANGGSGVTTSTGSGANVLGTSPTLTTPTITTPTFDSASLVTISGTAPLYMCRAWVNFNGSGTVAIRASGNVSSITDNGTGNYTVNFTTAMSDANYGVALTASAGINNSSLVLTVKSATQYGAPSNQTTTACQIFLVNYVNSAQDTGAIYVSVFR